MLKFKAFKQEHCMAVLLQYCLDCFIKMCHYAPFSVDFDAVNIPKSIYCKNCSMALF